MIWYVDHTILNLARSKNVLYVSRYTVSSCSFIGPAPNWMKSSPRITTPATTRIATKTPFAPASSHGSHSPASSRT